MLIGTENTVFLYPSDRKAPTPTTLLAGESIRALAEGRHHRLVAVSGGLVLDVNDGQRRTVARVDHEVECILIIYEQPLRGFIGTDEAYVYTFDAEGQATRIESFDRLPCRNDWHTPWGGPPAVRSMAGSGRRTIYADIHVGSIMRSSDDGLNWQPVTADLDEDVHQVATCPAAPQRVYANTARAVYVSDDGGQSWSHRGEALNSRYGRAIAVDPDHPDRILATVSDGPHGGNGQLYRSEDAGRHWSHATAGFPSSSKRNIDTFQIAFGPDGSAWAAVEDVLYTSVDGGKTWTTAWTAPQRILRLEALGRRVEVSDQ